MRDFIIMTDSSCDLPTEIVERYNIHVAPMGLTFNDKSYKHYHDFRELSVHSFYEGMRNGKIGSTSGINIQGAIDVMQPIVESGKDIIFLSLSSGLSCSYQNVRTAANELMDEYPDSRIEVIDTKSVTLGVGLMTYLAAKKKMAGETFESIVEYLHANCEKVSHYFTVDDLSHLQRGGRISHLASITGTLLGIKPILAIGEDGKIQSDSKVRGRKASIKAIVDKTKEKCADPSIFCICHADSPDDANAIKENMSETYPEAEFIVNNLGPIVGMHVGIGTLAIICMSSERQH